MLTCAGILMAVSLVATPVDDRPSAVPREIVQKLDYFVGEWKLEGRGANGSMKSSWSMRWAPGKHCVIVEYTRKEPGRVILGNGVWSWDSASGEIVYHASYADQGLEHIRTKVVEPDLLKGRYAGSLDGKHMEGSCDLKKEGPDSWTFKTTGLVEHGQEEIDVRFVRVGAAEEASLTPANSAVPPDVVKQHFEWLIGAWIIEGYVGDDEFTADCTYQAAPGGDALITHWIGGFGTTHVHGTAVIGWDSQAGQVLDSGFIRELGWRAIRYLPNATGTWECTNEGFIQGQKIKASMKVEIMGDNTFVLTSEENETSPKQQYRFIRVGPGGQVLRE